MNSVSNKQLLNKIVQKRFSLNDLRLLCFDLDIDFENVEGEAKSAKIIWLINHLSQRNRLDEVIRWIQNNRQDIAKSLEFRGAFESEHLNFGEKIGCSIRMQVIFMNISIAISVGSLVLAVASILIYTDIRVLFEDLFTSPTPTSTPAATSAFTSTPEPTVTSTFTSTPEPTATSTFTSTPEPTATSTFTSTPEPTATAAHPRPTSTPTPEATATFTLIPTATFTPEATTTLTPISTTTFTPVPTTTPTLPPPPPPEDTPVPTNTATFEPTPTFTIEPTATIEG